MARMLKPLLPDLVLVGGTATGLLITDPAAAPVRPTVDVDVITLFTSYAKYSELGERLRNLGFQPDTAEEAPNCRWVIGDNKLDVMPSESGVLGFSNLWYPLVLKTSQLLKLEDQIEIRMINAPCFIATKLEAFTARSALDYGHSKDLEDIITIINGRAELISEVREAEPELRAYIAKEFREFLAKDDFIVAIPGYLLPDSASQARAELVLERFRVMSELA